MKRQGRIAIMIATGAVILGLLGVSVFNFYYGSRTDTSTIIAQDIQRLRDIFHSIHEQCTILSFDDQQNEINFLNTVFFVGSEVGSMNLEHPDKWQGPYLTDHPTIQSKEYMVVRTNDGYFITPGNGVRLPNGKVIGKDIILDENADIPQLIRDDQALSYHATALAGKLNITTK